MQTVQPKYGKGMTLAACLWLGLFPLLQGGTYAHITHDKWICMLILTALTVLCFLADLFSRRTAPFSASVRCAVPLCLGAALLCFTLLSCLLSQSAPSVWWLGEGARYEGLATELCYFLLFFLFAFSRVNLKPVLLAAAAGVTAFLVIVLLQRGGGNPLGLFPPGTSFALNPEFQGTIGNVDMGTGCLCMLAGLFLLGGIHLFPFRNARGSRTVLAVVVPAFLVTVFLIVTMGVQFGIVTLAVLLLFTLIRFLPRRIRLPLLILLLVLALLLVWFWPGPGDIRELHEILHGRGQLSFGSNRAAVWLYSLRLAGERLLAGGGSATFPVRFNRYLAENNLTIPSWQDGVPLPDYFDNPHNVYLAQLTDHGLPTALAFAALILAVLLRKREGFFPLLAPCSAAVLCYAVQGFFSFSVCIVAPLFWVLLGMALRESPEALS